MSLVYTEQKEYTRTCSSLTSKHSSVALPHPLKQNFVFICLQSSTNRESSENDQRAEARRSEASRNAARSSTQDQEEEDEMLKKGDKHLINLFEPVSHCMLLVVATISKVSNYQSSSVYLIYTPFHEETDQAGNQYRCICQSLP
ncbi:Presenilin-like [Holothuria leucospilota]|uniref:Presenilin-like n=1 Tax=Holothuria leucospilota TaxID=206669 RepID=A0A9Q1HHB1_HOLLE|nr:Presenilin-like [Holothuria leucospilota]